MKQSVLNSPKLSEFRKKKQRQVKIKIIATLIIFIVLVVGLSFLSKIPDLNINNINITGNKIIETKEIQDIIEKKISGHYLWLFPKTNFIIYPQNGIKKDLKNSLKRIKNISINDKNIKTLEITIEEYEGKYLYCGVSLPELTSSSSQKCYFLDSNGYIFDEAPYFSGEVYFKFYGDSSLNKENILGTYFLKDKFTQIIMFKDTIEKLNLKPIAFWTNENKKEGNFSILKEPLLGPYITFKMDGDYQKLAENLQAAISSEPLRSDLKTKSNSLLYIDLRFGNKVYYKFE